MILVRVVSELWSAVNFAARRMAKFRAPIRLDADARIIGIGNLQAGGAGKTPVVIEIAKNAIRTGQTVVIMTRGYGSELERSGGYILGRATPRNVDPSLMGDEAALIHDKVPEASIVVGKNRLKQFRHFVAETGVKPDLIVLDDSFQQFRLVQDQKVLLVTSRSRSQAAYRDFFFEANQADLIIHTKGERPAFKNPEPHVRLKFEVDVGECREKDVAAFCAIADAKAFEDALSMTGCRIRLAKRFSDHHRYSEADLSEFFEQARAHNLVLVTTEKDWVKIKNLEIAKRYQVIPVKQTPVVVKGQELWETLWRNTR